MIVRSLFPLKNSGPFGPRRRKARGTRIPVTLLTGFLGAGKTTLLKHFLESEEGRDTVVIVNEFGSVGIDGELLRTSAGDAVLLPNGCLCCTVRSDLEVALFALIADADRKVIPAFRRVVIETSGAADPTPILLTMFGSAALRERLHVDATLTLVDAVNGIATLGWSIEARAQVALADCIVITKRDLVSAPLLETVRSRVRSINTRCQLLTSSNGIIDGPSLAGIEGLDAEAFSCCPLPQGGGHSDGISSFVLEEGGSFTWAGFESAIRALLAVCGTNVLRIKGFVNIQGCAGPVLINCVQAEAYPPVELEKWSDPRRRTQVVFILRDLPHEPVVSLFAALRTLAATAIEETSEARRKHAT